MHDHSLGRLVAVLFSPEKTFRSIGERPTWFWALAVSCLAGVLMFWLALPKVDWDASMRAQLAQSGAEITEQQIEQGVELMEKWGSAMFLGSALIIPWIVNPLVAVLFFVLLKILGSDMGYKASLGVTVYGFAPALVAMLASIPVVFSTGDLRLEDLQGGLLASNAAAFAGEDVGPALQAFLVNLDVFSFWVMALLVIGYRVVAKVSTAKAVGAVGGLWIFYLVFRVGTAALGQMMAG